MQEKTQDTIQHPNRLLIFKDTSQRACVQLFVNHSGLMLPTLCLQALGADELYAISLIYHGQDKD